MNQIAIDHSWMTLSKAAEKWPAILNQYAVVHWGGHQFAEGVCGVNYFDHVYMPSLNSGFKKKGDGLRAFTPEFRRDKTRLIEGGPDYGLGSVGKKWQQLKTFKIRDILANADKFNYGYSSFYITPLDVRTDATAA